MKLRKIDTEVIKLDMTPMIDIVFQLMTFFVIAINFENIKADERIKLPKDMLAKPPAVKPEYELVLNFGYQRDRSGAPVKPYPEVFYNEQFVEVQQIGPVLEQERRIMERIQNQEDINRRREMIKDVTVVIRADSEVPTGLVQELIRKCQEAGFSRFSLRATAEER